MKRIMHRIKGKENTYIEAALVYDLGGHNVWTSRVDRRGYYMTIRRVERENGFERFALFDGKKVLVKEVRRKSKKAEAEAEKWMTENYETWFAIVFPDVEYSSGATIM